MNKTNNDNQGNDSGGNPNFHACRKGAVWLLPFEPSKRRILLVEDNATVREWVSLLIRREKDLSICGEAEDVEEALIVVSKTKPDLVVTDLSLKRSNGLDLIIDLQTIRPALPVLVLSMDDASLYAKRVVRAGAKGYVTKQTASKHIIQAIREVLAGGVYLGARSSACAA
jgi:DNA-binding NarL/FixJ family response regulator